jgi:hypothetical protein
MHINFFKADRSEYTLGTVSFNWLNEHNAFDLFQEDHNEESDIIFVTTGIDKCNDLSAVVRDIAQTMPRPDLQSKLFGFADFLMGAEKIAAVLDEGFPERAFAL